MGKVCPPEGAAVTNIRSALSSASCALLGVAVLDQAIAETMPWDIDIGLLSYSEKDRNTGLEFLLKARRALENEDEFSIGVEIDTLTGATPNGASPSNVPQTFTQSSGQGSYTVDANELPADDTHNDTRLAVNTGYVNRYTRDLAIDWNARLSLEFDYQSIGLGNNITWDLNQNNTTLLFSLSGQRDMVHPVGNLPDPLALMTPAETPQNRGAASTTRSALDMGLGITQILDRQSLLQLRISRSQQEGYLTDPYKIFSVIDDGFESPGVTLEYRFENRPIQRDTDALYLAYKRQTGSGILDLSYRYISDSWNLESNTAEIKYRYPLAGGAYLQPKLRLYQQSSAYFYRHSVPDSEFLPLYVSADTRLADYNAVTVGLTYGKGKTQDTGYRVVGEYYMQEGEGFPDDAVGLQAEQNMFPRFQALVVKLVYRTEW